MITRLFNSRLPLMIYNPAKVFSLNFFIKAYKAGALPVFDTEFLSDNNDDCYDGVEYKCCLVKG